MSNICPLLSIAFSDEKECIEVLCAWWSYQKEWEENGVIVMKPAQCTILE